MDDGVRSRRLLLRAAFVAGCACAIACAAHPNEAIGFSHDATKTSTTQADAGKVARTLDVLPADYRAHMSKVLNFSRSQHALGRYEADVWADQAAFDANSATLLVEEHRDKATGKPGPVYVMKKETDGWRWYAQDETGVLLDARTNTSVSAACAGCHAEAPHDAVFR